MNYTEALFNDKQNVNILFNLPVCYMNIGLSKSPSVTSCQQNT